MQINQLQVAKYDKSVSVRYSTVLFKQLIQTHCLAVKVSCRELGDMGSIPDEC